MAHHPISSSQLFQTFFANCINELDMDFIFVSAEPNEKAADLKFKIDTCFFSPVTFAHMIICLMLSSLVGILQWEAAPVLREVLVSC